MPPAPWHARFVHALRRSIAAKLTLTLVGFAALTMLGGGLYLDRSLDRFAIEALEGRLVVTGRIAHDEVRTLLREGAAPSRIQAFARRAAAAAEARVTVIAPDGRVLGESERSVEELGRLDSHVDRPEVRDALAGRIGRARRVSTTLDGDLVYVALPVTDAGQPIGVLRLAIPRAEVTSVESAMRQVMLVGAVLVLAVACGIGMFVAGRVTRQVVEMQAIARGMSEGDFSRRVPVRSVDEIGVLGRSLNAMAAGLREKIQDLADERAKATAILDAMVEGVIAVDGQEHILLMNERARAMFGLGRERGERQPFLEVIRNADLHEVFRQGRGGTVRAGPSGGRSGSRARASVWSRSRRCRCRSPITRPAWSWCCTT